VHVFRYCRVRVRECVTIIQILSFIELTENQDHVMLLPISMNDLLYWIVVVVIQIVSFLILEKERKNQKSKSLIKKKKNLIQNDLYLVVIMFRMVIVH